MTTTETQDITLQTTEYRGYTVVTYFNKREIWAAIADKNDKTIGSTWGMEQGWPTRSWTHEYVDGRSLSEEHIIEAHAIIDEYIRKEEAR